MIALVPRLSWFIVSRYKRPSGPYFLDELSGVQPPLFEIHFFASAFTASTDEALASAPRIGLTANGPSILIIGSNQTGIAFAGDDPSSFSAKATIACFLAMSMTFLFQDCLDPENVRMNGVDLLFNRHFRSFHSAEKFELLVIRRLERVEYFRVFLG